MELLYIAVAVIIYLSGRLTTMCVWEGCIIICIYDMLVGLDGAIVAAGTTNG